MRFARSVLFLAASAAAFSTAYGQQTPAVFTGPAATPIFPIGIEATTTELLFSQPYCQTQTGTRVLDSATFSGSNTIANLFATLPDQLVTDNTAAGACAENYFAISPSGTVFVSVVVGQTLNVSDSGANWIYSCTAGTCSPWVQLPTGFAKNNHASVTFDTIGTFQNALIVTGIGGVQGYDASKTLLFTYGNPNTTSYALESSTVAPQTYTPCPGCLFVTATQSFGSAGEILTVAAGATSGTMMSLFSSSVAAEPENILFVPSSPGSLYGFSYFVSGFTTPPGENPCLHGGSSCNSGAILAYTAAQLKPYAGQFLIPDEVTGNIYAFSAANTSTIFSSTGYQLEGATLVPGLPQSPPPPPTGTGCPATQGFWKHHNISSTLSITISGVKYTGNQLQTILTMPAGGNAVLILADQTIAAAANVAAGAQATTTVLNEISQAEALLATAPSFVAPSSTLGQTMVALANLLDQYNSSAGTLGCTEGSGLTL